MNHYTFHSIMESQAFQTAWPISQRKRAELKQDKIEVWEINHLMKYNVKIGDNSHSSPEPVDSNPTGVN